MWYFVGRDIISSWGHYRFFATFRTFERKGFASWVEWGGMCRVP